MCQSVPYMAGVSGRQNNHCTIIYQITAMAVLKISDSVLVRTVCCSVGCVRWRQHSTKAEMAVG